MRTDDRFRDLDDSGLAQSWQDRATLAALLVRLGFTHVRSFAGPVPLAEWGANEIARGRMEGRYVPGATAVEERPTNERDRKHDEGNGILGYRWPLITD